MSSDSLRILYAGNPLLSVATLEAIAEKHQVVGVLVHPDKRAKRGSASVPVPVKASAVRLGIPVVEADTITPTTIEEVRSLGAELLLSFATSHYFTQSFLSLFPRGAMNIHPSLLPLHRGPSPIQYSILKKDQVSGISLQKIVKKIDSGDIVNSLSFALSGDETSETLSQTVSTLAAQLTLQTLDRYDHYYSHACAQEHGNATFTSKLTKEDGAIDFSRKASDIHAIIRALYPWPKAYTYFNGVQLILSRVQGTVDSVDDEIVHEAAPGTVLEFVKGRGLAIACSKGTLYVDRLQLSKKKEMDARSFVNGNPGILGARLMGA